MFGAVSQIGHDITLRIKLAWLLPDTLVVIEIIIDFLSIDTILDGRFLPLSLPLC